MNAVILHGKLGKDPEVKYASSGTAICNLSVATTEKQKKDGTWQDTTEWHKVIFFGSQAEAISKYMQKGSSILLEGRLQTSSWDDKDGKKHYSTEIIGNRFEFVDSKKSQDRPQQQGQQPSAPNSSYNGGDETLPF